MKIVSVRKNFPYIWKAILFIVTLFTAACSPLENKPADAAGTSGQEKPRIVNIINFIRLLEPRDAAITETVLYETVVKQIELMNRHKLGGTFLLQYDALMDKRYQNLLKTLSRDSFEIGGWWELPQPLVEKAGIKWRGRFPWDWHADVGFSTGYTPKEREKLIDVYMEDFKTIFGYYPESVGSWFIDEHSLNYMHEKYGIVASSNCKDQYGTDGYTLWGGYWNQAYYPSKLNAYMPAQSSENQIPVPVFRMLGSDPVRQYDYGVGSARQGVITLEPVYPAAGADSTWVNWFFEQFIDGPSMDFAYTQAGQENSFTWAAMSKGLEMQFPLIAKLRDEKKLRVETLAASGKWFRERYRVTPATSVTALQDLPGENRRTAWFNSRFYRANLLWEDGSLRFRDIHLFDERLPSRYLDTPVTSNECFFYTLPFIDGYLWSRNKQTTAGLWFRSAENGAKKPLAGGKPRVSDSVGNKLLIEWPLSTRGALNMEFEERALTIRSENQDWFLELTSGSDVGLPFRNVDGNRLTCSFENFAYAITMAKGRAEHNSKERTLRFYPENGTLQFVLDNGR